MQRSALSVFSITGLLLGAVFVTGVLLYSSCSDKDNDKDNLSGIKYLNHSDSVGYVGMQICARCHLDVVQSFSKTGMGSSFDIATIEKSAARFGPEAHVYDKYLNLHYAAYWKDSLMYISEYRLDDKGDTIHFREQRIHYIIGSGQHTNSHLFRVGPYLYQAPMTWYSQDERWDLPPGFEDGHNSRFSRQVDVECISCHNAMPEMEEGSMRAFKSIGNGINCERCHGPGELHVQFRMTGGTVMKGEVDSTIVNPRRLPAKLQIDVCQRCHLQGNNVLKPDRTFTGFKPGMKLKDWFEVYSPEYHGEKVHFNMADHSERLQMSQCFRSTRGTKKEITCLTCHNPHVSVKQTGSDAFNNACRSCHSVEPQTCTEPISNRKAVGNNCVTCHMPLSGSKDIPHVRIHDHRIAVPDSAEGQKPGKLKGLYAVNNENPSLSMKARAYLTYYEKFTPNEFYLNEAEKMIGKLDEPALLIHLHYLRKDWDLLLATAKEHAADTFDAMTNYRISTVYSAKGNLVQAYIYSKKALEQNADLVELFNDLAVVQIRLKYLKDAEKTLLAGLEKFPNNASLLSNAGYVRFLRGDASGSLKYYQRSEKLHPDHTATLENLVLWHLTYGKRSDAVPYLKRILDIDPENEEAKKIMRKLESGEEFN